METNIDGKEEEEIKKIEEEDAYNDDNDDDYDNNDCDDIEVEHEEGILTVIRRVLAYQEKKK